MHVDPLFVDLRIAALVNAEPIRKLLSDHLSTSAPQRRMRIDMRRCSPEWHMSSRPTDPQSYRPKASTT
jgi:hypothetical protein